MFYVPGRTFLCSFINIIVLIMNDYFECARCKALFEHIDQRNRHSKSCHLNRKRRAKTEDVEVPQKKLVPTLLTDFTEVILKPRVIIGSEIFELENFENLKRPQLENISYQKYFDAVTLKYDISFTIDHLACPDYPSFLSKDIKYLDGKLLEDLRFYQFVHSMMCKSKRNGRRLLEFVNSYSPSISPPKSWSSAKIRVENILSKFSMLSQTIPFPKSWNIDDKKIKPIKIICDDILEHLAYVLADPKIQSSNIFHLRAYQVPSDRKHTWICNHLMSSKWALKSQERIDNLVQNPILIAFIPYEDGVTVDNNGNRNCDTVVGTFGNFSRQARQADFSKFHIGFIPKLEQENLLLNVLERKFNGNKRRANEELKIFKLKIRRDFYNLALSPLKSIAENGDSSPNALDII